MTLIQLLTGHHLIPGAAKLTFQEGLCFEEAASKKQNPSKKHMQLLSASAKQKNTSIPRSHQNRLPLDWTLIDNYALYQQTEMKHGDEKAWLVS